jgi:hypothetical protein
MEGRVGVLEGQPNGAVMSFNFSPTTDMARSSGGFPSGEIHLDTEDQEAATFVMVSVATDTGANARLALASGVPGTVLVLQQTGDVNQYALAMLSDNPVDMGDHFMLPISSLTLASYPLTPGPTGLSAAGISQGGGTSRPPAGPMGPEGVQGSTGEPGPQGEVGPQGPQGDVGPAGAQGAGGPPGPQGEIGPQGSQGETGAAGASTGAFPLEWKTSVTATNPAHGYIKANSLDATQYTEIYTSVYDKNGQALVTLNEMSVGDEVYVYESGQLSTWNRYKLTAVPDMKDDPIDWAILSVTYDSTGPRAFTPGGNTQVILTTPIHGEAGPPGPMGPAGSQGVAGSPGSQGVQGEAGPSGPMGPAGAQGVPGSQGIQGVQGPQGPQGDMAWPWIEVTTTTANATPKSIATIPIPASTTVMIEMQIVARRTGGAAGATDDGGSYIAWCTYKNLAGTATIIGNLSFGNTDEDVAAWDVTTSVSGSNVSINVIGANMNVSWKARYRTYSVS